MTETPAFDGPRRIKRSELTASEILSNICFGETADPVPEPPGEAAPPPDSHEDGQTFVVSTGGRLVAQISTFQETILANDAVIRAGCIGGVCTHPGYRNYRLASRLMETCAQSLYSGGARVMLISGGRGLYQRMGCHRAGRYAVFTLRPGEVRPHPLPVTLRPVDPASALRDALVCSRLYAQNTARYRRGIEQFIDHFRRWSPGYNQEEWIVEVNGSPEAYLMLNKDWDYLHEFKGIEQRRVNEYGGSPSAVAAALAQAAARPEFAFIEAAVPWQEKDLIRQLADLGAPPAWTTLDSHTLRILNFPGLLYDLRPYIQARLSPSLRRGLRFEQFGPLLAQADAPGADRMVIARGKDRLELSAAEMTALVFGAGPETVSEAAEYGVHLALPQPPFPGALADIIAALFPLPAFLPGINYH